MRHAWTHGCYALRLALRSELSVVHAWLPAAGMACASVRLQPKMLPRPWPSLRLVQCGIKQTLLPALVLMLSQADDAILKQLPFMYA